MLGSSGSVIIQNLRTINWLVFRNLIKKCPIIKKSLENFSSQWGSNICKFDCSNIYVMFLFWRWLWWYGKKNPPICKIKFGWKWRFYGPCNLSSMYCYLQLVENTRQRYKKNTTSRCISNERLSKNWMKEFDLHKRVWCYHLTKDVS